MPFFLYITESGEVTHSSLVSFAPLPVGKAEVELTNPAFDPPWIFKSGSIQVPDAAELASFPAAQLNIDILKSRTSASVILAQSDTDMGQVVRALALVTLDQINVLRSQHSLAAITKLQLLDAVDDKITTGLAD